MKQIYHPIFKTYHTIFIFPANTTLRPFNPFHLVSVKFNANNERWFSSKSWYKYPFRYLFSQIISKFTNYLPWCENHKLHCNIIQISLLYLLILRIIFFHIYNKSPSLFYLFHKTKTHIDSYSTTLILSQIILLDSL